MSKLRQLSPELWPLIDVILFSYIELIFRCGVSRLPVHSAFIFPIKVASNGYLRGYVSFAHFLLYFYFVLIQGPDIR